MTIDFEKDRMQSVEQIDSAKRLSDKVLELKDLEDEIANAEESLKKLKELKDGEQVEIKKIYGASIPKDQQGAAFTWLRNNGLGDVIKNDITVTFGRGEDNKAAAYADLAKGQGFEPVQKIGVNPMTLKALVRERLENGQDVPTELFKPFEGNQTKITRRN
jgi:hypothetical protein